MSGEYLETQQGNWYEISGNVLSHNGEAFGWGKLTIKILQFDGTINITDLPAFPFRLHPDQENQRDLLLNRCQRFLRLLEPALKQYQGQALKREVIKALVQSHGTGTAAFDDIVTGRIHFSFYYPKLQKEDRARIWKTFLAGVSAEIFGEQLRDEEPAELAEKPMKGREVSEPHRKY
ncbi:putative aaa family atpase [Diaporthe ampelina]|uniref:Putative aaa family atpase n=1 Tax=Diaporthe ampelina TaxID=1214573 RepID=A0A0G2HSA0_9PEZI|nr:putative aaa family atpase [Diaporthe ampelina]